MSGANGSAVADITLDELERLIKLLGMLGSSSDGEALAAARFASRWVRDAGTSWEALLTPEEEVGVSGVGVGAVGAQQAPAEAEVQRRIDTAFQDGFRRGSEEAAKLIAAQMRAQQAMGAAGAGLSGGLGAGLSGSGASRQQTTGSAQQPAQGPPRGPPRGPPGGLGGAGAGPGLVLALNPYPSGTWKWVAWELLERHDQGVPGVFRSAREQAFVSDVLGRGFATLTQAQEVWLRDIAGRSGMSW